MLATTRLFQALGIRHYARQRPLSKEVLLKRTRKILKRQPTSTAKWHAHLRKVRQLITDLHPATWEDLTWEEWKAQLKLWRKWMNSVRALHDAGALRPLWLEIDDNHHPAQGKGDLNGGERSGEFTDEGEKSTKGLTTDIDLRKIKADDFTPLFLSLIHRPKGLEAKLEQNEEPWALKLLSIPDVLDLMFDLGLMQTPFQLTLLLQHMPIDELLSRVTPPSPSSSHPPSPSRGTDGRTPKHDEGLNRAAASLRPVIDPQPYDTAGLKRRRGIRHHEIEYAKMLLNAAHLCMRRTDQLAGSDDRDIATYKAALDKLRPYWQKYLRFLVWKVATKKSGIGPLSKTAKAFRQVSPTEAFAAKLQIEDTLRTGKGPRYRLKNKRGVIDVIDLSDPIETLKFLAAAVRVSSPPPPPSTDPLFAPWPLLPTRPAAPDSPGLSKKENEMIALWAKKLMPPESKSDKGKLKFLPEAVSSLVRLSHAAAKNKDFKMTLRLCDVAAAFPIPARMAMYLAGAVRAPEDLERMLPKLEALKVEPVQEGKQFQGSVGRLLSMAQELDRMQREAAEEAEEDTAEGVDRGDDKTTRTQGKRGVKPYLYRAGKVMSRWGLL